MASPTPPPSPARRNADHDTSGPSLPAMVDITMAPVPRHTQGFHLPPADSTSTHVPRLGRPLGPRSPPSPDQVRHVSTQPPTQPVVQSSEEEVEESSDGSDGILADFPPNVIADIWVPPGNWRDAARYAYALVLPAERSANPAPFIRAALLSVLPSVHVEILPSSRSTMLLRFVNPETCDLAASRSPIHYDGGTVELVRSEDTDNRFIRAPSSVAYLVVEDFPLEHWFKTNITAAFRGFGTVTEIDPTCLSEFDFSSLRLLVAVSDIADIPRSLWISAPGGQGAVAKITVSDSWPRDNQYDAQGRYLPFFPPPPPPPPSSNYSSPMPPHQHQAHSFPGQTHRAAHFTANPFAPQQYHSYALTLTILANASCYPLPALPCMVPLLPWHHTPATPLVEHHPDARPPPTTPPRPAVALLPEHQPLGAFPPHDTPPPPSAVSQPLTPTAATHRMTSQPPTSNHKRPRGRPRVAKPKRTTPQRHSERLAKKEPMQFVDSTTRAVQLRALKDALTSCSKGLQELVAKRALLGKRDKAIAPGDLRKVATKAGLGEAAVAAIDRASAPKP